MFQSHTSSLQRDNQGGQNRRNPPRGCRNMTQSYVYDMVSEQKEGVNPRQRLPVSNGEWSGEEGNSEWYSYLADVREVVGNAGIPFCEGRPDFSQWAEGEIDFPPGVLDGTQGDFAKVYQVIMEWSEGCLSSQSEAAQWLSIFGLTPHHASDTKMLLVPTKLHRNIPHIGSASDMRGGY